MGFRAVSIGTTTGSILSYNGERTGWTLINNGSANLTISDDPSNVSVQGMPIASSAGAEMSRQNEDDPTLALFGISASGNLDIRVQESFGRSGTREPAR